MATISSVEGFLTASTDHQDACFRLLQYAARLIGALHVGRRQASLFALSDSMDASRIMTRTFGIVYALRAAMTKHACRDDLFADLSLCGYHPCEAGYWWLLATASPKAELRRNLGRLTSLFGVIYAIFAGRRLNAKLRELRTRSLDAPQKLNGTAVHQYAHGDFEAAAIPAAERRLRHQLWKNALDGLLCCHWALDHSRIKLSHWQVGLVGSISAYLGLRLHWNAHTAAVQLKEQALALTGEDCDDEYGEYGEVVEEIAARDMAGVGDYGHGACAVSPPSELRCRSRRSSARA